jgi:hypothetical protein
MNRATSFAAILAAGVIAAVTIQDVVAEAAPPKGPDSPMVPSVGALKEKELKWGMSHLEVINVYNDPNGLFDKEYAPLIARLQPGIEMQKLEAARESRKANFLHSYNEFGDSPNGLDVTPLHSEYTYNNEEAIMRVNKDGKNRAFFFIKDKLWKIYDEIPLKADGALGDSYQGAVTKLGALLGTPGRDRKADASQGLEREETDWQDAQTHMRADDRSGEHLVGVVLEWKPTLMSLASLRTHKAQDPFAIDPSIAAVTKGGVSDPNAAHGPDAAPAASAKHR